MSGLISMPELGAELPVPREASTEELDKYVRQWRELKDTRLELEKKAREAEKQETLLFNWLCSVFKEQGRDGTVVEGKATGLTKGRVPTICDKHRFLEFVKRTGSVYLLECRLSKKAAEEVTDAGGDIEGVEFVEVFGLYNRKV